LTVAELKNKIILELLTSNKLRINETIDYNKFAYLYSFYNYLPEFYFAKILEINYQNFRNLKSSTQKATVLKNFDYMIFKEDVLNYFTKNKIAPYNVKLNNPNFLKILDAYPYLSEESLANILGIKSSTFTYFKTNKEATLIVLKKPFALSKEDETIIEDLINKKIIYPGQTITYEYFIKIHKLHPDIKEYKLASMLEIKSSNFCEMKKGNSKCIILKSMISDFIIKQKSTIINDLINTRNALISEKINYKRFLELYQGYEYINEIDFAKVILGINYSTFRSMKADGKNAIILKSITSLTDEQSIELFNFILNRFKLKEGDMITYELFLKIYNMFSSYFNEKDLAEIIGITEDKFLNLKYKNTPSRIINGVTTQKMFFIKPLFSENRFYTKQEIEDVINYYNISIDDFIIHIINKKTYFETSNYVSALNKNKGLFIGKVKMSNSFFQDNYNNILKHAKYIIKVLRDKNLLFERDDTLQEIMLYISCNCGDLQYNFDNSDIFYNIMRKRCTKFITGHIIDSLKQTIKTTNFYALENTPSFSNEEDDFISEIDATNDIYSSTLQLIDQGYSFDESLNYLAQTLQMDKRVLYEEIVNKCKLVLSLRK